MSKLIVDMPMPKNCAQCRVWSICEAVDNVMACESDEWCYEDLLLAVYESEMQKPKNCPIKGELVRCGECGHYHSEDDPPYCDELCTIHIEKTDGCLRGIKRGGKVGYRAADGERKEKEND